MFVKWVFQIFLFFFFKEKNSAQEPSPIVLHQKPVHTKIAQLLKTAFAAGFQNVCLSQSSKDYCTIKYVIKNVFSTESEQNKRMKKKTYQKENNEK